MMAEFNWMSGLCVLLVPILVMGIAILVSGEW